MIYTKESCEYYLYNFLNRKDMNGSFANALVDAFLKADSSNLELLGKGFPEMKKVVYDFRNTTDYWKEIEERNSTKIINRI